MVGKNASKALSRRPSQALKSTSPTRKRVPSINNSGGAECFIPERELLKNSIAEAQKKRAARKAVQITPESAPQPARSTHSPGVEECCGPELDCIATSTPAGSTDHEISNTVMVTTGNDGQTTTIYTRPIQQYSNKWAFPRELWIMIKRDHQSTNNNRDPEHLTIIELAMYVSHVLDRKLLERLMSPSPKSQVMFGSAFSWIGDFFRIFGIHIFQIMASLGNLV